MRQLHPTCAEDLTDSQGRTWTGELGTVTITERCQGVTRLRREGGIRDSHLLRSDVKARHDRMVKLVEGIQELQRDNLPVRYHAAGG
jgi:hypothetical protein